MVPRIEFQENVAKETANGMMMDQTQQVGTTKYRVRIKWLNVSLMSLAHVAALIGLRQCFSAKFATVVCAYLLYALGGIGVTAGSHRLWSHRSFKANLPLRVLLACLQSLAYENSIYVWARDHRVHHKYSETDADPHNAKRGFFFSHIGWVLCKKHPDVIARGKQIDLSDLHEDKVVMLQDRYYYQSVALFCFIIPTLIPYLFWGETLYNSFLICGMFRFVFTLHSIWLINSVAHKYGRRPYDKSINPSESKLVSFFAVGEGFHNYHHTFAWDYAASELGYELNLAKLFIDFFALFGWAYDRKVVTPDMIKKRKARTGDVDECGPYGPHNM